MCCVHPAGNLVGPSLPRRSSCAVCAKQALPSDARSAPPTFASVPSAVADAERDFSCKFSFISIFMHTCDLCDKSFRNAYALRQHDRDVHEQSAAVCARCGRSFATHEALQQHMRDAPYHGDFSCDECDRSFRSQQGLDAHWDAVHNTYYECDLCGKDFGSESALTQHERDTGHGCDGDDETYYSDDTSSTGTEFWWKAYERQLYRRELTPYQGEERVFGKFSCSCGRWWCSAHSWADTSQGCTVCGSYVYPYKQTELARPADRNDEEDEDRGPRPHRQDLCEKCTELGSPCWEWEPYESYGNDYNYHGKSYGGDGYNCYGSEVTDDYC